MRTRFPPSPTGFLHIGGLRTALYSYLVAKKAGGTFYLRIEDTDQEREVAGATENILRTLHWASLDPDEGIVLREGRVTEVGPFGPYVQSKRLNLYREYGTKLLETGHAYRCFCTKERLEEMRRTQEARHQPPMYDGQCRGMDPKEVERRIKAHEPHVIRLKVPRTGTVECHDTIRGRVQFSWATVDDQILLKSDGWPTYHLAHVIDDHLMETTIVIRGEEWLPSLPKHLLLFEDFGWDPPAYAHVPLILAPTGGKLSKRHADVAVEDYIAKGYLPEALVNFLAFLGWNPGTSRAAHSGTGQVPVVEKEIYSLKELTEQFSLERVQKAGATFDLQKLNWLQGQWVRKLGEKEFAERILPFVIKEYEEAAGDREFSKKASLIQERITLLSEAPSMLSFFYEEPTPVVDLLANPKQKVERAMLPTILNLLTKTLDSIGTNEWLEEKILQVTDHAAKEEHWTRGQLLWVLRAALTGKPFSPGALEVASGIGKERTLKRLTAAKEACGRIAA